MVYLFLVNITLLVCYVFYNIFFRKLTFFQWNRFYLLGSVVLSLIIPVGLFIDLSSHTFIEERIPIIDLAPFNETLVSADQYDAKLYLGELVDRVYWLGAGVMLISIIIRFCYVLFMVRYDRFKFSYTFFHLIAVKNRLEETEAIINHERIHAQQGHSYDIFFMELVRAFNWFNPVLTMYLKELKFQHECIADADASADKVAYARLLVAQAMYADSASFLQEFSNKSLLKKRIVMLFKSKSKKRQKYLYFSIAPILFLVTISTLVFNTSKAKNMLRNIESDIKATELTTSDVTKEENMPRKNVLAISISASVVDNDKSTRPEPAVGRTKFMHAFANEFVSPRAIDANEKDPFMAVTFHVSAQGNLSDFKLAEGALGLAFFDEAVRLIKKSTWVAAIDSNGNETDGKGVVMFKLDKSGKVLEDYTRIDVHPEPKGGVKNWQKFIGENYIFPKEFIDKKQKGKFTLSFHVGKTGVIENMSVLKETFSGTAKPAEELVRKFGAWVPGIFEGENVDYQIQFSCQINSDYGYGVIHVGDISFERLQD